jgi:hypothetical protein
LSNRKRKILERVSSNAVKFDAAYIGKFVCPTCLVPIPLDLKSEITEAHIIPKYSGGSLKTYLCNTCNSHFGNNQDHWFGEYVYLASSEKGFFATRKQNRTFTMNGVKVAGEFKETDDGTLEFYVYQNLMSPEAISAMKAAETPGRVEITTQFPILKNTRSIIVGFLTAAYLLWFKELGYSWVFQAHLNPVRTQILNPNKRILSDVCVVDASGKYFEKPWIGFLEIDNDSYPCAGIADRLVILPSYSNPNVYELLAKRVEKQINTVFEAIRITDYHMFPEPVGIIYRDQIMIFPDHFCNCSVTPRLIRYLGDGQAPQIFYLMDENSNAEGGHAHVIKIR